jgi:hypothetical protein
MEQLTIGPDRTAQDQSQTAQAVLHIVCGIHIISLYA